MTTTTTNTTESMTYTIHPCGTCGVQVHNGDEVYAVTSEASETLHNGESVISPHLGGRLKSHELSTCADCSRVQEQAGAISSQFPGLHRSNVRGQVRDALAALDAAQLPVPSPRSVRTPAALRRLVDHLVPVSRSILYAELLAPIVRPESREHVGEARWEHVTDDQRDRIRDAYADLLLARVGSSDQVPCPSGACMFCGVQSIKAKPAQAGDVWREATTTRKSLGARRKGSQRVSGHLCPDCAQAREDVGSWGPTAVETAIFRHLDHQPNLYNAPDLRVPAWGALTDAEPNGKPWEHIDLDDLSKKLERAV